MKKNKYSSIESIISISKKGGMYILVDDENRENEGDLVFSASDVNAQKINFMAKHGRGLICLTLNSDQAKKSNKPAEIIEKMVEGRLKKFYKENVLIEQDFVKDPNKTIKDIITDTVGKLGENIVVSRFRRFQLGEKN